MAKSLRSATKYSPFHRSPDAKRYPRKIPYCIVGPVLLHLYSVTEGLNQTPQPKGIGLASQCVRCRRYHGDDPAASSLRCFMMAVTVGRQWPDTPREPRFNQERPGSCEDISMYTFNQTTSLWHAWLAKVNRNLKVVAGLDE